MKKHPTWQLDPSSGRIPGGVGFVPSQHKHSVLLVGLGSNGSVFFPKEDDNFAASFNRRNAGLLEGIHDDCDCSLAACRAVKSRNGWNGQSHEHGGDCHDSQKLDQRKTYIIVI